MTAIDFPNSPSVNDTFTINDRTWKWTGTTWDAVISTTIVGPTGPQGNTGTSGVVFATSPITYNSETQSVAFDQTAQNTTNDARYFKRSGDTIDAGTVV